MVATQFTLEATNHHDLTNVLLSSLLDTPGAKGNDFTTSLQEALVRLNTPFLSSHDALGHMDEQNSPRPATYQLFSDVTPLSSWAPSSSSSCSDVSVTSEEMAREESNRELEEKLKNIVAEYLCSKDVNPFQGSVPVEKVQNILRNQHPELYSEVVGMRHRSWNSFLERHADTFEVFSVESGKWRMRLLAHEDYQLGDQQERALREAHDTHLLRALTQYLISAPDMACTIDEFIAAYPTLSCNSEGSDEHTNCPLPKRGDLVRFIKRQSNAFTFDPKAFLVRLSPSYLVEALVHSM